MKIDIEDIPEAGLSVDVSASSSELIAIAGKLDFTLSAPVQAHLEMLRTGGEVQVSGEIKAALGFVCSRCLKEFAYPVDSAFSLFYTRQRQTEKEKELTKADFDVNLLASNEIDTTEILLGQLTLEAPMKPAFPMRNGFLPPAIFSGSSLAATITEQPIHSSLGESRPPLQPSQTPEPVREL